MAPCPSPEFKGATLGDLVNYVPRLQSALDECNAQLGTLRDWVKQQGTKGGK